MSLRPHIRESPHAGSYPAGSGGGQGPQRVLSSARATALTKPLLLESGGTGLDSIGSEGQVLTVKTGKLSYLHVSHNQIGVKSEAGTLAAFSPVQITGFADDAIRVAAADAVATTSLPATGILLDAASTAVEARMAIAGTVTGFDTTPYAQNAILYVAEGGGFTDTPPPEAARIQAVCQVFRVDETKGSVKILSHLTASALSAIPALTEGDLLSAGADGSYAVLSVAVSSLVGRSSSGPLASVPVPPNGVVNTDQAGDLTSTSLNPSSFLVRQSTGDVTQLSGNPNSIPALNASADWAFIEPGQAKILITNATSELAALDRASLQGRVGLTIDQVGPGDANYVFRHLTRTQIVSFCRVFQSSGFADMATPTPLEFLNGSATAVAQYPPLVEGGVLTKVGNVNGFRIQWQGSGTSAIGSPDLLQVEVFMKFALGNFSGSTQFVTVWIERIIDAGGTEVVGGDLAAAGEFFQVENAAEVYAQVGPIIWNIAPNDILTPFFGSSAASTSVGFLDFTVRGVGAGGITASELRWGHGYEAVP